MTKHVAVVGAGIVGISAAIWLRRMGVDVTVIDRAAPGMASSYGNAGLLASCAVVPVTTPGLVTKSPRMLLDRDYPLFLRWRYFPRLLPWLARYLAHANDHDTRRISRDLAPIISDSVDQHLALTEGLRARDFLVQSDYVFAYADRAAFDADGYIWALRRIADFVPELIEGDGVREYDPAYGPAIGLLARMKDHGYLLDPGAYVASLAAALMDAGGKIVSADVRDVEIVDGKVRAVLTDSSPVGCDRVVLAAGAWSGPLMKRLGVFVPMETERGYHIVFGGASGGPKTPTMIVSGKFVATPMSAGLRCAGIVEFGGLQAGPSKAPLDLLRRQARRAFPELGHAHEETWQGHRPTPADSLPLIGEIGTSGVFAGFGHQHIGLTGGPKTGRLVAALVTGRPANLDLSPYDPHRFRQ